MIQEINSYLVLENKEQEYLILKRFNDIWEFPGGGVEFSEHPKQTAIRECFEEVGIKVLDAEYVCTTSATYKTPKGEDKHSIYLVYFSKVDKIGEIKLTGEHKEYLWINSKKIKELKLGLNCVGIIEKIEKKIIGPQ